MLGLLKCVVLIFVRLVDNFALGLFIFVLGLLNALRRRFLRWVDLLVLGLL